MARPDTHLVQQALERMRGRRALLIGDLMLDAYVYGETVRVSREAPVLVVRKDRVEHRLGGAANTAANLAALGVQTELLSVVGTDSNAKLLCRMLEHAGADLSGLERRNITTAVKTRIMAGAFGTSKQQVLRLDDEPEARLSDDLIDDVLSRLSKRAANADVVVVSDYGLGLLVEPIIKALKGLAKEGHTVCVDSRYQMGFFDGVTAVTPNVPETEALLGFPLNDSDAMQQACRQVVERLGCQACLLTQGRAGMTLFRADGGSTHVAIVGNEEVTDVTGAGDTVTATFSAALGAGLGMENGMRLANCAAGIVVTKAGTGTASSKEILDVASVHDLELTPWERSST